MTKLPISFIEMQDLNPSKQLQENTEDHKNQLHMDQKTLQKEHSFDELDKKCHDIRQARRLDTFPVTLQSDEVGIPLNTATLNGNPGLPPMTTTLDEPHIPNTTTKLDEPCINSKTATYDESCIRPATRLEESDSNSTISGPSDDSGIPATAIEFDKSCIPSMTTTLDESATYDESCIRPASTLEESDSNSTTSGPSDDSGIPATAIKFDKSCIPSMTTTLDESATYNESCIPPATTLEESDSNSTTTVPSDDSGIPATAIEFDKSCIPSMTTTLDESGVSPPTTPIPSKTHYQRTPSSQSKARQKSQAPPFPSPGVSRGPLGLADLPPESHGATRWCPKPISSSLEASKNPKAFSQSPPRFFGNTALTADASSKTRGPTKTQECIMGDAPLNQGPTFPYPPTWHPSGMDPHLPWPPVFPMYTPPWAPPANHMGKCRHQVGAKMGKTTQPVFWGRAVKTGHTR